MDPLDPRGTSPLSPRERAALARIETGLLDDDPRLAREFTQPPRAARFPVTAAQAAALVGLLALVVVVAVLLPPASWVALGPVTVGLLAPWIAWCARAPRRTPPTPPPGGTA